MGSVTIAENVGRQVHRVALQKGVTPGFGSHGNCHRPDLQVYETALRLHPHRAQPCAPPMPVTDGQDTSDVVSTLLRVLEGSSDEEKAGGLMQLAMVLDACSGTKGTELGEKMRAAGGIRLLVHLVDHAEPTVHQTALHLVANFSAEAVDARNEETKRMLKELGAFAKLLRHLFSDDPLTLEYALGAVRNTCRDPEHVTLMQEAGVLPRLEVLTRSGDTQLEAYAEDVRRNVTETILEEASGSGLERERPSSRARKEGEQPNHRGSSSPLSPARSTASSHLPHPRNGVDEDQLSSDEFEADEFEADELAPLSPARSHASATSLLGRSRPQSAGRPQTASHRPQSAARGGNTRPASPHGSLRPMSPSSSGTSPSRGASPSRGSSPLAATREMQSGEWPPRVPDLQEDVRGSGGQMQAVHLHSEVRSLHDYVAAQDSRLAAEDGQMHELRGQYEELQQHMQQQHMQQQQREQSDLASRRQMEQQQLRQKKDEAALARFGGGAAAAKKYEDDMAAKKLTSDQQMVAHAMWRHREAAFEAEQHAQRARAQFSEQRRQLMLREEHVAAEARASRERTRRGQKAVERAKMVLEQQTIDAERKRVIINGEIQKLALGARRPLTTSLPSAACELAAQRAIEGYALHDHELQPLRRACWDRERARTPSLQPGGRWGKSMTHLVVGRTDHGSLARGGTTRGSPSSTYEPARRTFNGEYELARPASAHPALRTAASAPVSLPHHYSATIMRSGSRGDVMRQIEASPVSRKPRIDKPVWSADRPGSMFTNGPIGSEPTLFNVTGEVADLPEPKPRQPFRHPGHPLHTEVRPAGTRQESGKSCIELGGSRKLQVEDGRYFLLARENETPRHFARLLGVTLGDMLREMKMSNNLRFKAGRKVFLPSEAALDYKDRADEAAAQAVARAQREAAVAASFAAANAAAAPNGKAQLPGLSVVYSTRTPIKNGAWKHPTGWLGL